MEANKQVVRAHVERFNAGDPEGLRGLFTEDAEVHGVRDPAAPAAGR